MAAHSPIDDDSWRHINAAGRQAGRRQPGRQPGRTPADRPPAGTTSHYRPPDVVTNGRRRSRAATEYEAAAGVGGVGGVGAARASVFLIISQQ